MQRKLLILAVLFAAAAVAGCGYKGSLDKPAEAKSEPAAPPSTPENRNRPSKDLLLDGLIR